MKKYILIYFILIVSSCAPRAKDGLDYYDYSEFEFTIESELSNRIFKDSINIEVLEKSLPQEEGILNVDYARNLKINILRNALYLTDNSNFSYYGNNGLAYVWGGKNHLKKMRPVQYRKRPNKCTEELYGLDCSGFIYQVFLLSGFKFFSGNEKNPSLFADSRFFSNPNNWQSPVREYCNGSDCLKVERINQPLLEHIESGDILFFYNSRNRTTHIGICLLVQNRLVFFDSGGNPGKNCEMARRKGPRRSILSRELLNGWKQKKHGIIKINNSN